MNEKKDVKSENSEGNTLGRRRFIAYSAGAGAGFAALAIGGRRLAKVLGTRLAHGAETQVATPVSGNSRVVIARSDNLFGAGESPDPKQVEEMLNASMRSLFDVEISQQAWASLFNPGDVVGIKVNCIAGPNLSSHPVVVEAIIAELKKIPIPEENIIVWDRKSRELKRVGYEINVDGPGVRYYGTDEIGYEENPSVKGGFDGRLSKILTQRITALINVPILKNHGGAGVSISMKNHYGSFHNPRSHHKNMCDPYIADLNSLDEIKDKTKLIVCDATTAGYNGGPGYKSKYAWQYSGLIMSTDPVALDTVGASIIDEKRAEEGMPLLAEAGLHPRCLASAAERGLGVAEMGKIDLRTLKA